MEVFDQIANWVSHNESLFSGLAAVVALIALRNADPAAAERHAREAKRIYPGLSLETSDRIVGRSAAGLLAPWLDGEDRLA